MSVERIRVLLGLASVEGVNSRDRRQQITPDMKFTCDGIIIKWIIGAEWSQESDDTLYPELQLWREIGNDTYQKINGTLITIETQSDDGVYEYDNFPPIPFQAGDILGVFLPRETPMGHKQRSKLRLRHEWSRGLTNYYLNTDRAAVIMSSIDLQQETPSIRSGVYHPLVTVEISECTKIIIYIIFWYQLTHNRC